MEKTSAKRQKIYKKLPQSEQRLIQQLMVHERKGYNDPVYFVEYHLGLTLHEGQKRWLRESDVIYNPNTTR